jgi:hypothetical protein
MYYVDYTPGTVARITEHLTEFGSPDPNVLSQAVVVFNRVISTWSQSTRYSKSLDNRKLTEFHLHFKQFRL